MQYSEKKLSYREINEGRRKGGGKAKGERKGEGRGKEGGGKGREGSSP